MTPGVRPATQDSTTATATSSSSSTTASCHAVTNLVAAPKSTGMMGISDIAEAELEELCSISSAAAVSGSSIIAGPGVNNNTTAATAAAVLPTQSFPVACRALLLDMEGNSRCLDCSTTNPEWAAVSYGAMVCLQCAGHHRSLGVNVSTVRSVTMDHWRYDEVIKMLEGGNRQLSAFFQRHSLGRECVEFQSPQLNSNNIASMRYKTKAALFYREQLEHHVQHLLQQGPYKGRKRNAASKQRRTLGTQVSNLE